MIRPPPIPFQTPLADRLEWRGGLGVLDRAGSVSLVRGGLGLDDRADARRLGFGRRFIGRLRKLDDRDRVSPTTSGVEHSFPLDDLRRRARPLALGPRNRDDPDVDPVFSVRSTRFLTV